MKTAVPTLFTPLRLVRDELFDLGLRHRELRALLDDIADIPWWHPAWWSVISGAALFEGYGAAVATGELHALYLSADGSPRIDTFMGRKAKNLPLAIHQRIARAVLWARAAVDTLEALDGALPRQPLHRCVTRERGWLRRRAIPDPRQVAFLTGNGAYLARVTPGDELALARALAEVMLPQASPRGASSAAPPLIPPRLVAIDRDATEPTPTAVAVSLLDAPRDLARHIHRQVWTRGGGPWLGVGSAPPYEITTTCHLVTDGYGHWLVTDDLLRRVDALAGLENDIIRELARSPGLCDPVDTTYQWRHICPAGVADAMIPGRIRFVQAAYTFGRALTRLYRSDQERARALYSPTFQVPIAPHAPGRNGAAGEAGFNGQNTGLYSSPEAGHNGERRRRRVVQGLMALRIQDGEFESFDAFRARLPAVLEREKHSAGILTRLALAAARIPIPDRLRQRYLGAPARPSRWTSLAEVLAGRGVLSCMRFSNRKSPTEPFYAAAAPPLQISPHDRRGAAVLTLMHHRGFVTATVTGTGLAATHDGAEQILRVWLEELERLQR